ncbi:MAG: GPW/gp25 family protein [Campylobacter hyointestinalis]
MAKYLSDVKSSIKDILLTPLGSRVMLPEYGSRIFELIDRRIDDSFRADLAWYVIEAVQKWEKRVKIDEVKLIGLQNNVLKFEITFESGDSMEVAYA